MMNIFDWPIIKNSNYIMNNVIFLPFLQQIVE
jgi:hypothetical protein